MGKTAVAIELALSLRGEVVSADSMQVYRRLDIGTAKPSREEMKGIPHHLIDVVDPDEPFNVARYGELARDAIAAVHQRGNLPILSGGTGLYVKAVLGEFLFPDTGASRTVRRELTELAERIGRQALHARLAEVDPTSAERIHPNDVRRVTRALEVYIRTGVPMSEQQARARAAEPLYTVACVGLTRERQQLYERINQRVLVMLKEGLLQEAEELFQEGLLSEGSVASQALGYKEIRSYLEGSSTLDEAVKLLQRDSRRYAKRQYTWFRNQLDVRWFPLDGYQDAKEAAQAIIPYVRHQLNWHKEGSPHHT